MGHSKQEIRDRLVTTSVWIDNEDSEDVTNPRTPLFVMVPENSFRYIVGIWICGNAGSTSYVKFEKLKEDDEYEGVYSPIPIAPADFRQIPKGSYHIEDPVVSLEGGTRLYGQVTGISINVSVAYWDKDF